MTLRATSRSKSESQAPKRTAEPPLPISSMISHSPGVGPSASESFGRNHSQSSGTTYGRDLVKLGVEPDLGAAYDSDAAAWGACSALP
jgi:hypothetical protein